MSLSYKPPNQPDDFWGPLFLAYRDITGQAPIDKVAYPGVHVTPACFSNNIYDSAVLQPCFSNLLSAQFRRLIIDLYWDVSNRQFTLCPAELPHLAANATEQPDSLATNSVSAPIVPSPSSTDFSLGRRQENATSTTPASSATANETAMTTVSSAISTATSEAGSSLLQLGPYQCTDDLTLDSIFGILSDYIGGTSDHINARFVILQFNLHAATPPDDADGTPRRPSPDELPSDRELVGRQFDEDFGRVVYTPADLNRDRQNLNASWFSVSAEYQLPVLEYYDVIKNDDGSLRTENGWPNEDYLLFNEYSRLLLTYGQISPEMEKYNFRDEEHIIFPANQTTHTRDIETSSAGIISSGCYYSASSKEISQVNNSWALTSVTEDPVQPRPQLGNLTSCGLAPTLNRTLDNENANVNYRAYQDFSQGAIFGWAPGEPRNSSTSNTYGEEDQFRCVVIDSSNSYRGHWRVANCQERFRAACRIGDQPFNWRLTSYQVIFGDAPTACPSGTEFGMPRTGLENRYLYEHILRNLESQNDNSFRDGVWINLNSLDVRDCWMTTGPNGSCVYENDEQDRHDREVLIPTIAALIVLILTVLTILVKCNVNRRNSRVRRMGPGGWEYEGVPS